MTYCWPVDEITERYRRAAAENAPPTDVPALLFDLEDVLVRLKKALL